MLLTAVWSPRGRTRLAASRRPRPATTQTGELPRTSPRQTSPGRASPNGNSKEPIQWPVIPPGANATARPLHWPLAHPCTGDCKLCRFHGCRPPHTTDRQDFGCYPRESARRRCRASTCACACELKILRPSSEAQSLRHCRSLGNAPQGRTALRRLVNLRL